MSRSKKRAKVDRKSESLLQEIERFRLSDWEELLPRDQFVALELGDREERLYVVRVEEDPGDDHLFILLGDECASRFRSFWFDERWSLFDTLHFIETCFLPAKDLAPPFLRLHQAAGQTYAPTQRIACAVAKEPGHERRGLRAAEVRLATSVHRLLQSARTSPGALPSPIHVDLDEMHPRCLLLLRGDERGKLLGAEHWVVPEELRSEPVASQVSLSEDLAALPRTDRTLAVRAVSPGALIDGDGRLTTFLLAYDEDDERVVNVLLHEGAPTEIPSELWETILRGEEPVEGSEAPIGLPRALRLEDRELFDSVSASLSLLGIEAELDPEHPVFQDIDDFLFGLGESLGVEMGLDEDDDTPRVHAPLTRKDWKAIDQGVTGRILDEAREIDCEETRRQYFGQVEFPEGAADRFGHEALIGSYSDWLTHDLPRGRGRTRKTEIERWIADPSTPPPVKKVLRARRDSRAGLFRVNAIEPGSHAEVVDVTTSEFHRVHDYAFSRSAQVGTLAFLRLYQVGEWTFLAFAGPLVPAHLGAGLWERVDRVLETFAREGRARGIEEAGKLWGPLAKPAPLPKIVNADGHPLRLQSLRFEVEDADRVESSLDGRTDLRREAPGETHSEKTGARIRAEWTWFDKITLRSVVTGGPKILGHIRLTDAFLELETNSNRRAGRAKQWLHRIEGVRLSSTTVHELPRSPRARPPAREADADLENTSTPVPARRPESDPEAPTDLDPEELSEIASQVVPVLRQRLMGWLDEQIPALGDRTPREAVRTESGRRQVSTLIHSMTPPLMGGGLECAFDFEEVRRAMLRELRLDRGDG